MSNGGSVNPLVIYHAGCWDGFCAAWLFKSFGFPDANFHAAHYGTEPPELSGRKVFVVDFSYKRDVMLKLAADSAWPVTVLDHHKTAQAELEGIGKETTCVNAFDITFDMGKSGGRLAWEYLWDRLYAAKYSSIIDPKAGATYDRSRAPWLVDYTEDRDLWRWALPDSREINAALRSYPLDFAEWDRLAVLGETDAGRAQLVAEGQAICRREKQIVDEHLRHAREIDMDGHKVLAVNATVLFSDIAGELAKDRPFGACYFDRFDGKRQWSLRSREGGVDVSEVARTHGGGGHRQAAGFEESAP